jgi:hypothetical protein
MARRRDAPKKCPAAARERRAKPPRVVTLTELQRLNRLHPRRPPTLAEEAAARRIGARLMAAGPRGRATPLER